MKLHGKGYTHDEEMARLHGEDIDYGQPLPNKPMAYHVPRATATTCALDYGGDWGFVEQPRRLVDDDRTYILTPPTTPVPVVTHCEYCDTKTFPEDRFCVACSAPC